MRVPASTRGVASRVFAKFPTSLLRALAGVEFILPYYHVVSDHEIPHVKHLYRHKSVSDFKADLDFILAHYSPIDLSELLNHVQSGRPLPEKSFLLTFDDGFREMRKSSRLF